MALDKIDPASFMTAFGINPVLFARSQSALGFIEGYEHHLTAYDGVIGVCLNGGKSEHVVA